MKVGFIGLGLMGKPMAKNIYKAGFPLVVFNRNPEKTKEFEKLDIPVAKTPQELASEVDVVITMVTGPEDVKDVLLGKEGVVHGGKPGLVVIDMSTIGPDAAQEIAQELIKSDIGFLDAPVTGSTQRAIGGELTIFIGGKEEVFQKVKPVLEAMGKDIHYMGPIGSGQAIKLVNNLMVAISIEALAEGLLLGENFGLSREKITQALDNAPVISPMLRMKVPNMIKGEFPKAFSMANMSKDLKLAQAMADKLQTNLPVLKEVEGLYQKGLEEGLSEEDNSAILKVLEKN